MAKRVLLKDWNDVDILPITRGDLILDSSGNPAFHSDEFLATDVSSGLLSANNNKKLSSLSDLITFTPTSKSLTDAWSPSGFILNEQSGFESGVYAIKITSGNLMFSGTASVVVGNITVEDEIVLHMSGMQQVFRDGIQGRIFAKIAPSETADYGEIYLASNVPQSAITNLSITMKKLI